MMSWPNNAMDVFKLLEKSNCRECGSPTCLAFAAAVFKGTKSLGDCPRLDDRIVSQYSDQGAPQQSAEAEMEALLMQLKQEMRSVDLQDAAARLGGNCANGKLTIKILGKDFSVDQQGRLYSDIHVHSWITLPFLNYLLKCQGVPPSGRWVSMRELEGGKDWAHFFEHRCEKPLQKVADAYPDLFADMVQLFNGRQVENHYESDISVVMHPFPKLPLLICYWRPEEGMASDLHVFFDSRAESNLNIESIYALGAGLLRMFEKIALRHGVAAQA